MIMKRKAQQYISILNINTFTEEASLEFRLRKIDETRNCHDEINHNDLISKIYEKIRGCKKRRYKKCI